jgi:hypothetical protein
LGAAGAIVCVNVGENLRAGLEVPASDERRMVSAYMRDEGDSADSSRSSKKASFSCEESLVNTIDRVRDGVHCVLWWMTIK